MIATPGAPASTWADAKQSALYNEDIAPTPPERRTWRTYDIAALWIGMCVCIPTYMLASGLIAAGMSWRQAIFTIALGNVIVLVPMILNGHAGARYGIPFPVLARASFGVLGANVPAILRALVACGWFGIQTWIGGQALHTMLGVLWTDWPAFPAAQGISFLMFWIMNLYFIFNGTESIRWLESVSAPFLILVGGGLLAWAYQRGGGWGPILQQPGQLTTLREFWPVFMPSLTGMVGYWATLSLNIPDFTRYAKNQRAQIWGQALGLPSTMALYSFIGVAVTSATILIFGVPIWDPVDLLSRFNSPLIVLLALVSLLVATLTTNIAANVVSPANDFSNLWPRRISFRTGGMITAVLGVAMMPWKVLADYGTYIFGWLIGYSSFLGPIAGILIADYWLLRRGRLDTVDLYVRRGVYEYTGGLNLRALLALCGGVGVALLGLFIPALRWLYDYAWFVGFAGAFGIYMLVMSSRVQRVETVEP
ncbi:MAG TPA: NCS1 family nucleobase:cation symporter-1 [bacterium]|nr:NCS1 family nucleobase:cation symporter-1 [bacterium]